VVGEEAACRDAAALTIRRNERRLSRSNKAMKSGTRRLSSTARRSRQWGAIRLRLSRYGRKGIISADSGSGLTIRTRRRGSIRIATRRSTIRVSTIGIAARAYEKVCE